MIRESLRGAYRELTAESMRAATLVGLAAIPAGAIWIVLWGTGSGAVVLLAGGVVGLLYSGRSTPAHRAGARAGIFAPLPESVAQVALSLSDLWGSAASLELKIAGTALFGILAFLTLWVLLAVLCIVVAAVVGLVVDRAQSYLPGSATLGG